MWNHCLSAFRGIVAFRVRVLQRHAGVFDGQPWGATMIRKLKSGKYRLYSKKKDPKTGKRKNLGTFDSRTAAEKHERAVQHFKRKA